VVDGIQGKFNVNSNFNAILIFCKSKYSSTKNFKISFNQRHTNIVAHLVAKMALSYDCSQLHECISCIMTTVMNEMN